jgi:hypothetical protein
MRFSHTSVPPQPDRLSDQLRSLKYIIHSIWILGKNLSKNLPVNANAGAPAARAPLGESPLLQEALDTRHQIDRVDGLNASNEGSRGRDALQGRSGHGHRRRGRRGGRMVGCRGPPAAAQRCGENEDSAENSSAELTSHRRISPSEFARPQAVGNLSRPRSVPWARKPCQWPRIQYVVNPGFASSQLTAPTLVPIGRSEERPSDDGLCLSRRFDKLSMRGEGRAPHRLSARQVMSSN